MVGPRGPLVWNMSRISPRRVIPSLLLVLLLATALVAAVPPVPADDAASGSTPAAEPIKETIIANQWDGHIACGVGSIVLYWATCATTGHPDDEFLHIFNVSSDIETLVVAVDWDPASPLTGQELHVILEEAHASIGGSGIISVSGPPPLEFRVDDLSVQDLRFRVFSSGEPAGASLDQPFSVYYHEFYGSPASENYTALP